MNLNLKMRKKESLLSLGFILLSLIFLQGALADGTATDGSTIYQCGTVNASGVYNLNQSFSTTGNCLRVQSDDIYINFEGYTITGDGGALPINADMGVYFLSGESYNNLTIINGSVSTFMVGLGFPGSSPYTGQTNNSLIENMNVVNNSGIGVYVQGFNGTINNLNASKTKEVSFGAGNLVQFKKLTSGNWTIKNSNFEYSKLAGILIPGSGFNLTNNTFSSNGVGIEFSSVSTSEVRCNVLNNNYIYNSSFNSDGGLGYGIYFNPSTTANCGNHIISGGIINSSEDYGIYMGDCDDNVITDLIISNTRTKTVNYDVFIGNTSSINTNSTNNTFINVTYNLTKEYVESGSGEESEIIRKWYVDVEANNSAGYLSGAEINITNSTPTNVFSELTGTNGNVSRIKLIEYINDAGIRTYPASYVINSSKTYYIINSTTYNLTALREADATDVGVGNVVHNIILNVDNNLVAHDNSNVIYQCGIIPFPGTYLFNQSIIDYTMDNHCINISTSNILINLMGYNVTGENQTYSTAIFGNSSNEIGVDIFPALLKAAIGAPSGSYSNITIKNGTIKGYNIGLAFVTANIISIINMNVLNTGKGIYFQNSGNATIENSSILGNEKGINFVTGCNNLSIKNTTFKYNTEAIGATGGSALSDIVINDSFFEYNNWFFSFANALGDKSSYNKTAFSFYRNKFNHNHETQIINSTTLNSNRSYPKDSEINIQFNLTYVNDTSLSNFNYNFSIYPNEDYIATTTGNNLSLNFTPTKNGIYTIGLNLTETDYNNTELRNYLILVGDLNSSSSSRYYLHQDYPSKGQPVGNLGDFGSLLLSNTSEDSDGFDEEERHCIAWTLYTPQEIEKPYPLITSMAFGAYYTFNDSTSSKDDNASMRVDPWVYSINRLSTDYVSSKNFSDTGAKNRYQDTPNYVFNTTSISGMEIKEDYLWSPYWLGIKFVTSSAGTGVGLISNGTYQSYIDINYSYAGPKINELKETNGSDIRNIRLLSSVYNTDDQDNATLQFDGTGDINLSVEMPDSTKTYSVLYDGVACVAPNCTIDAQANGVLNLTVALG
jgi:hypothetical protein